MSKNVTNRDVAEWMLEQLNDGPMYQQYAARRILEIFGDLFVHQNEDEPLTIQQGVLRAFKDISLETVVWQENERMWRLRKRGDKPGRVQ